MTENEMPKSVISISEKKTSTRPSDMALFSLWYLMYISGWPRDNMDRVSRQTRSAIMASVQTKHTGAEKSVRSIIHKNGLRFRLHSASLPGHPDIVFPKQKKVLFVHGCFWHGHKCKYGRLPKSKLDYWEPKIARNRERDRRQIKTIRSLGWKVMVVWQCELKKESGIKKKMMSFLAENSHK